MNNQAIGEQHWGKNRNACVDEKTIEKLVAKRDELKKSLSILLQKIERDRSQKD